MTVVCAGEAAGGDAVRAVCAHRGQDGIKGGVDCLGDVQAVNLEAATPDRLAPLLHVRGVQRATRRERDSGGIVRLQCRHDLPGSRLQGSAEDGQPNLRATALHKGPRPARRRAAVKRGREHPNLRQAARLRLRNLRPPRVNGVRLARPRGGQREVDVWGGGAGGGLQCKVRHRPRVPAVIGRQDLHLHDHERRERAVRVEALLHPNASRGGRAGHVRRVRAACGGVDVRAPVVRRLAHVQRRVCAHPGRRDGEGGEAGGDDGAVGGVGREIAGEDARNVHHGRHELRRGEPVAQHGHVLRVHARV